jgi:hypothetical protein
MIFLASLFGAPCPKTFFGALLFKLWGLTVLYFGATLLGALDSMGHRAVCIPRWNRRKNRLGPGSLAPRFLNFGAWRFLGNLGSLGPRAETLKQGTTKTVWPPFWGLAFSGGFGSLGSRTSALFGPRDETVNKKFGAKYYVTTVYCIWIVIVVHSSLIIMLSPQVTVSHFVCNIFCFITKNNTPLHPLLSGQIN